MEKPLVGIEDFTPGKRVKSKVNFAGVPMGTSGYIIQNDVGVVIGWDLPDKPWKPIFPIEEYRLDRMWAVNPECPLRDGFSEDELHFLELE